MSAVSPVKIPRIAQSWQPKPFPVTALKFIEACNQPDCTARDLAQIVALDPLLAATILKLANSSALGCGQKIKSIDHAIVLLGMKSLKKFAVVYGTSHLFQEGSADVRKARQEIYEHTLSVASWCKYLTKLVPDQLFEEMFLIGMLHDIGKLMYLDHVPAHYAKVLAAKLDNKLPVLERHIFGQDHAELGANCLQEWKLSDVWADTVRYHHEPENSSLNPEIGIKVHILACANYINWHQSVLAFETNEFKEHLQNTYGLVSKYLLNADFELIKNKVQEETSEFNSIMKI